MSDSENLMGAMFAGNPVRDGSAPAPAPAPAARTQVTAGGGLFRADIDLTGVNFTPVYRYGGKDNSSLVADDTTPTFMFGGTGDDSYTVKHETDRVYETPYVLASEFRTANGNDTVYTTVSFSLDPEDKQAYSSVENLTLTGTANINATGNSLDNRLTGNDGNNILDGRGGNDTLAGGRGDDTYLLSSGTEQVTEKDGEGTDTIKAGISLSLENYAFIENLTLTGTGNLTATGTDGANVLTGNAGNNLLTGKGGNDTLSGGDGNDTLDGGTGADQMAGGAGDDLYLVDDAGDAVDETGGNGTDTVRSTISFSLEPQAGTLSGAVENLTLLGTADLNATGNELANVLTGNDGKNILDGRGGNDTLIGGKGDDTYIVSSGREVITELDGGGTDTLKSSITLNLENYWFLENLTLTGTASINATGNNGANVLTGNSGNNRLTANAGDDTLFGGDGNDTLDGGEGRDRMEGGKGDDTYIVDNIGDLVNETGGDGTDTIETYINYSLVEKEGSLSGNVENLTLLGTVIYGTGNDLANTITGNDRNNDISGGKGDDTLYGGAGADTLTGGEGKDLLDGGMGADSLSGGAGDDVYVVDNSADSVDETGGNGTDTVKSSTSFSLADATVKGQVENLTLTGTGVINGTGNDLANEITGNVAANRLSGGKGDDLLTGGGGSDTLDGGEGADTMKGGLGSDTYIVDNAGDVVDETGCDGADRVESSISFSLAGDRVKGSVEVLALTGTKNIDGTGNDGWNELTGNSGNNFLSGGKGEDTLFGEGGNDTLDGGEGNDLMIGGDGDDTFIVDDTWEGVYEFGAGLTGGHDLVKASVTFALNFTATEVEDLTLTGTGNINGTGNALANVLTGNSGANVLDGLGGNDTLYGGDGEDTLVGGTGADSMAGGAGGDDYYVDDINDVVFEESDGRVGRESVIGKDMGWIAFSQKMSEGAKTDRVFASISYTLTDNVEVLALRGGKIDGTGNSLDNAITGTSGDNVLNGMGGSDRIWGGAGADTLDGGTGDDWLDGGYGRDGLTGGAGRDAFVFGVGFPNGSGKGASWGSLNDSWDKVTDFTAGEDQIVLSRTAFAALNAGETLSAGSFLLWGKGRITADTRVIYDQAKGELWYDADGSGAGFKQVLIATFTDEKDNHPTLTAADFLLIA